MLNSFIAIDVETANNHQTSVCAIGAVKIKNGIIADTFYTLVKPYPNFYFRYFTEKIHGISRADTDSAPCFAEIWPYLHRFIGELPLVAHNKAFDMTCLKATARHYGIDFPDLPSYCTLMSARQSIPRGFIKSYSLPYVADFLGIPFRNHHNALADAMACAKIALTLL